MHEDRANLAGNCRLMLYTTFDSLKVRPNDLSGLHGVTISGVVEAIDPVLKKRVFSEQFKDVTAHGKTIEEAVHLAFTTLADRLSPAFLSQIVAASTQ